MAAAQRQTSFLLRGGCGIMVIVIGNRFGNLSSNPGTVCISYNANTLKKHVSNYSPSSYG